MCLYEDGGSFMGKSKDILCFSWLLLAILNFEESKALILLLCLFCSFLTKCLLVQIELDQIVASLSISSPKRFVQ